MTENLLLEQAIEALQGCVRATDVTNIDRMKVAVCGETGTGKSCLVARTCRKPLMAYDFDDRAESIAGNEGVIIKTLVDKNDETPTAWVALESDMGTLEYLKSKNELPFNSIMLDSCTFLRRYAEHQFMKETTASRNKFKIGMTNYIIPKDWDAVTAVQKMLDGILNRAFALKIDVYMTFHTRQEKDAVKSTKTDTIYKDSLTIDPPNLKVLLPKFNDKWRTYVGEDGKFMVQLKADWKFAAASVLKNVGNTEEANIQEFLKKHKGAK